MSLLDFLSTLANGAFGGQQQGMDPDDPRFSPPPGVAGLPAAPAQQAPSPAATPHDAQDIMVQGDRFHARHQTILGAIADGYMQAHGMGTPFDDERNKRNMEESVKGITTDPMTTVRRIAQFDPDAAVKLYNQVSDNQRQQSSLDRSNRYLDLNNENLVYNRVANAMSAATPQNWTAMREQMLKTANSRGVDMSGIIPETYSPDAVDTIRFGAVPVKNQMQLQETSNYHTKSLDIRQQNANTAKERNGIMASQGQQRIGVSRQNANTAQTSEEKRPDKSQLPSNVVTPYGAGQISPDGKRMVVPINEDRGDFKKGDKLVFIKIGSKWVPSGTAKNFGTRPQ